MGARHLSLDCVRIKLEHVGDRFAGYDIQAPLFPSEIQSRLERLAQESDGLGSECALYSTPGGAGLERVTPEAAVNSAFPDLRCLPRPNKRKQPQPSSTGQVRPA